MTQNHQIDLNVDLTDEKDEFKDWFKDQINKGLLVIYSCKIKF